MPDNLPPAPRAAEIDRFLQQLKAPAAQTVTGSGRLIIGLDATASRQPTWDTACRIQGEMFEATAALGGLEIQLVFYRGYNECKSSRWVTSAAELHTLMRSVSCVGGNTQIARLLDHAIRESQSHKIGALVFVGDAMEEEVDRLCQLASELGRTGVPVIIFHEGHDPTAAAAFKQIAALSGGACLGFDRAAIGTLKTLLAAVAVFATGGRDALADYSRQQGDLVRQLVYQLGRNSEEA